MKSEQIVPTLRSIAREYPPGLVDKQLQDVERIAFHIELVLSRKGAARKVCDLGGGVGLFPVGCQALGINATLVDDFGDIVNENFGEGVLGLHKSYGVDVVSRDLIGEGIDFPAESFDAVTTFDSMEHWHHSPKKLFHAVMECLTPGGLFILGVPNNVNLRKRITVPLGVGNWSPMEEWYEPDRFRGHVREPSVADLLYIARDMGLTSVSIFGRNWLGYTSRFPFVRALVPLGDKALRRFPSLCSDIYMIGTKP